MILSFREARRTGVPRMVALLADDALAATRETPDLARYLAAFDALKAEAGNIPIVGEKDGAVVATCQITFITGLSLRAAHRARIESVRVDAAARARAARCTLMQLTTNRARTQARSFYRQIGFTASHIGFKREL